MATTNTYTITKKDYTKYFHNTSTTGNNFVDYLYKCYHEKNAEGVATKVTKYKNYLLVTTGGKVFTHFTNAYSYMLSTYVEQKLGFDSSKFKIDKETWKLIEDSNNNYINNRTETNTLNAICTRAKQRVAIGKWNSILVHSSADYLESDKVHDIADIYNDIALQLEIFGKPADNDITESESNNTITISVTYDNTAQAAQPYCMIYLVNEKGDTYYYDSTTGITLKEMLEAYMEHETVNLTFESNFTINKATWNDLVTKDIKNNLPLLIKTFNALCKKQKYRIAVCTVQPCKHKEGFCIFPGGKPEGPGYWSADTPLTKPSAT